MRVSVRDTMSSNFQLAGVLFIAALAAGCDPPPPRAVVPPPVAPPVAPPVVPPANPVAALDSPQAVMQKYEDAKNRRDFKTQAKYLTPETLQAFAAMQIGDSVGDATASNRAPKELAKRGVTAEKLKELADAPADQRAAKVAAVVAGMTDLPGLYAEVMSRTRTTGKPPPATITGVDIQGDRATAHVEANLEGQVFRVDVELRRYADGWKVDDSRHYMY